MVYDSLYPHDYGRVLLLFYVLLKVNRGLCTAVFEFTNDVQNVAVEPNPRQYKMQN